MFGAIAGGIASALAGGAMSKLFGGGQKAASGGIQGDVLATDNNTVGMGDAGIKSAIQGSNVPNPDEADRKSGSAGMPRPISYAVFCLKKKTIEVPTTVNALIQSATMVNCCYIIVVQRQVICI